MALRHSTKSLSQSSTQIGIASAGALALTLASAGMSGCAVEGDPNPTGGTGGQIATGGMGGSSAGQAGSATAGKGGTSATGGVAGTGGTSGGTAGSGGQAGSTMGGQGGSAAGSGGMAGGGMGGATGGAGSGGAGDGGMSGGGGSPGGTGGQSGGASGSAGAAGTSGGGGTGGMSSSMSEGCNREPGIPSSMYNNGNPISIMAANRQRRYILSVPDDYDNTRPYNLVIAWHQLDGNDKQMYSQNFYWLKDIPDAASSTIFVAPNGEKGGNPCTGTGVAEGGCGWPDSNGSNVALADAVVAQVAENFCIDKNRIFANGWSYGGSMSYRTACSRPLGGDDADWGVRAVAVYNGAAQLSSGGCTPSQPVAFYASHGTNDGVLGYEGGVSMATTFARVNGCTAMTPTRANGNHVCTNYMGCMMGYPVEFCSFVGDHTPDPRDGGQRWQPQEVWEFFSGL